MVSQTARKSTLLVVDADPSTLDGFRRFFPEADVRLLTADTAAEGLLLAAQERPDAVVLDLHLPDVPGLGAFARLRRLDERVPVILTAARGTAQTAIEAMKQGAYEDPVKPLDFLRLRELVGSAFRVSRFAQAPPSAARPPEPEEGDVLVGDSAPMQEIYKAVGRVAPQDVNVLITGESGTGKELVARAIHTHSRRADRPFLAINCAAIPETLLESELFGHERGAFTGAERQRVGKFEQCSGGTLFLDEIGDMSPLTQAKILRVLQDQQFERVGGNEVIRTDVRVIAATNRNLERMAEACQFRGDLYYRLNVFAIHLPPLRERREDLPLLVRHFLRKFSRELGKEVTRAAPEVLDVLMGHSWPGNLRE